MPCPASPCVWQRGHRWSERALTLCFWLVMTLPTPSVILCAIDFSGATKSLLHHACALTVAFGAELRLLHVREQTMGAFPSTGCEASWLLDDYQQAVRCAGVPTVSTMVRSGEAAQQIVLEAAHYPADLLLLGAHGCTTEQVLRTSPCPTLVLSDPGTRHQHSTWSSKEVALIKSLVQKPQLPTTESRFCQTGHNAPRPTCSASRTST
jgi:nucleotide-binding universal stress UspA family protein